MFARAMTKPKKHSPHHSAKTDSPADPAAAEEAAAASAEEVPPAAEAAPEEPAAESVADDVPPSGDAGTEEPAPAAEGEAEDPLAMQLLRLRADFENYRKRTERERAEWARSASKDLALSLLPALDDFDRGLAAAGDSPLVEGFALVEKRILQALAAAGAEPMALAAGDEFDPAFHEAISQLPSADVPEGRIMAVARKGWLMGGKLLRAAQVVVSGGAGA
jgi:molecular chaperone GrpE